MRLFKLKRISTVVVLLVAALLVLHFLLACLLPRTEETSLQVSYLHILTSTFPPLTRPSHQPFGTASAKSTKEAAAFGPLRAFLEQCAPSNASEDLYEAYFTNRQLCKEPLLEDQGEAPLTSPQTVLFTLRTTAGYHHKRLPLLFDTWLSTNISSTNSKVVIITDAHDEFIERTAYGLGIGYVVTHCPQGHNHSQLCCKAGEELATALRQDELGWLCHVDDDMYVQMDVLMRWLSKLDPRRDHVYMGRASNPWRSLEGLLVKDNATVAKPGVPYDFALGSLYCLSRAMLTSIAPYLGTAKAFADVCADVGEADDVTLGIITGAVLRYPMVRTNLIHTHGHNLADSVNPRTLREQIAISYGYGVTHWGVPTFNTMCVPKAMFNVTEDPSQYGCVVSLSVQVPSLFPPPHVAMVCTEEGSVGRVGRIFNWQNDKTWTALLVLVTQLVLLCIVQYKTLLPPPSIN